MLQLVIVSVIVITGYYLLYFVNKVAEVVEGYFLLIYWPIINHQCDINCFLLVSQINVKQENTIIDQMLP